VKEFLCIKNRITQRRRDIFGLLIASFLNAIACFVDSKKYFKKNKQAVYYSLDRCQISFSTSLFVFSLSTESLSPNNGAYVTI